MSEQTPQSGGDLLDDLFREIDAAIVDDDEQESDSGIVAVQSLRDSEVSILEQGGALQQTSPIITELVTTALREPIPVTNRQQQIRERSDRLQYIRPEGVQHGIIRGKWRPNETYYLHDVVYHRDRSRMNNNFYILLNNQSVNEHPETVSDEPVWLWTPGKNTDGFLVGHTMRFVLEENNLTPVIFGIPSIFHGEWHQNNRRYIRGSIVIFEGDFYGLYPAHRHNVHYHRYIPDFPFHSQIPPRNNDFFCDGIPMNPRDADAWMLMRPEDFNGADCSYIIKEWRKRHKNLFGYND